MPQSISFQFLHSSSPLPLLSRLPALSPFLIPRPLASLPSRRFPSLLFETLTRGSQRGAWDPPLKGEDTPLRPAPLPLGPTYRPAAFLDEARRIDLIRIHIIIMP